MKPVLHGGITVGKENFSDGFHVFFGNKHASMDVLKEVYPQYAFHVLKQVHGDLIVRAPASQPADGHWTSDMNAALAVYTADCLPVLICNDEVVAAVHAGWRGIASEIIPKSFSHLGKVNQDSKAFIGPHLQFNNFEVHLDVAEKLKRVGPNGVTHRHDDPKKLYVDLSKIAEHHLTRSGIKKENILIDRDNTFGNPDYFSHRSAQNGRLISFIARPE